MSGATTLSRLLEAPQLLTEAQAREWALSQLPPFSKTGHSLAESSKRAKAEASRTQEVNARNTEHLRSTRASTSQAIDALVTRLADLQQQQLQLEDDLIDHKNTLLKPNAQGKPSLLTQLEELQERRRQLSQAALYFGQLEKAERLGLQAQEQLGQERIQDALQSYHALSAYTLDSPQANAFVAAMRSEVFGVLKDSLHKRLLKRLEAIGWPSNFEDTPPSPTNWRNMRMAFLDLMALQEAEPSQRPAAPFALETLAAPLNLRFRYHFDGTRPTNRLDKPEWCFSHILNTISDHSDFIQQEVQPLLDASHAARASALDGFITQLVAPIKRKITASMPALLESPPLLAHTIFQALAFDHALEEQYGVDDEDRGVAHVILGNKAWFEAWREAELKASEDKYYEIISSAEAWQLSESDSSNGNGSLRPTLSALRLRDLLESVTDRYKSLPSFFHRLSFLLSIQVPLIEAYLQRVASSVDAIETLSVGIMRAVPGALGEGAGARLSSGVGGVQRLIKAGLSARWMTGVCQTWSDDVFFLEMRQDIQGLSLQHLGTDMREGLRKLQQGGAAGLFDTFTRSFEMLATRADELLVKHVAREVTGELKNYIAKRWDEEIDSSTAEDQQQSISNELLPVLTLYSALLSAMSSILPALSLQSAYRKISISISDYLYGRLSTKVFAQAGGVQIRLDLQDGWLKAARDARIRKPEAGWRKLQDAATLLALPAWPKQPGDLSFSEAMGMAWDDSGVQVDALREKLGLVELDQSQIKSLLRKRPECWKA